jgi:hypothetical protein
MEPEDQMSEKIKLCESCKWFGNPVSARWTGKHWESSFECSKPNSEAFFSRTTCNGWARACPDFEPKKPKLNNCPVCGGGTEVKRASEQKWWVRCDEYQNCDLAGPNRETEIEAIEAFNKLKYEG